jgi:RNA polymerase sigma-70 factor (ECF subfamily)
MEDDDLARIAALARRDRAALAALARGEGVSPEDAVDCVQEGLCTLLTSVRKRPDGALRPPPTEWGAILAGMVRNAARNRRRRHFLARPHDDIDLHPDARREADAAPFPDELVARAEEHVRLRACVEELCEIQRAVVILRMLDEEPGEDVARALGISAGHVAVLLHRAKAALRACMATKPI